MVHEFCSANCDKFDKHLINAERNINRNQLYSVMNILTSAFSGTYTRYAPLCSIHNHYGVTNVQNNYPNFFPRVSIPSSADQVSALDCSVRCAGGLQVSDSNNQFIHHPIQHRQRQQGASFYDYKTFTVDRILAAAISQVRNYKERSLFGNGSNLLSSRLQLSRHESPQTGKTTDVAANHDINDTTENVSRCNGKLLVFIIA